MKKLFVLVLTGAFILKGFTQITALPEFVASVVSHARTPLLDSKFSNYQVLEFETGALAGFVMNRTRAAFHLKLGTYLNWNIELEPAEILSPNYKLKLQTNNGVQTKTSRDNFLFKGRIIGENESSVRLAIRDGFIYGCIAIGETEIYIEPLRVHDKVSAGNRILAYQKSDFVEKPFNCGTTEQPGIRDSLKYTFREPAATECKKIRLSLLADYSMYENFNHDYQLLENTLLAIINMDEGLFVNLNLGNDSSTDLGQDKIEFDIIQLSISICQDCDIVDNSNNALFLYNQVLNWVNNNEIRPDHYITQFWTKRNIYTLGVGLVGYAGGSFNTCSGGGVNLCSYYTTASAGLRLVSSHEIGHSLGCFHDNAVKPSVLGFIMDSRATVNAQRFSRLSDFVDTNYSSNLVFRNTVRGMQSCLEDCGDNSCQVVSNLKAEYLTNSDSIKISWSTPGDYRIRYKKKSEINFDPSNARIISGDKIVLKQLEPCQEYIAEVQGLCSNGNYGPGSSINFRSSLVQVLNVAPQSFRNEHYDLSLTLRTNDNPGKQLVVFVDHQPSEFISTSGVQTITIRNLFADGARHRVDIKLNSLADTCTRTVFYKAPYYRFNSVSILESDFDGCSIAGNWKDSVIRRPGSLYNPSFMIRNENIYVGGIPYTVGSFDSTCMLIFDNSAFLGSRRQGALSFTSPKVSLEGYQDIKLSFDYINISTIAPQVPITSFIKVEVNNGTGWVSIFEYDKTIPFPYLAWNQTWDTIPARRFISLDPYISNEFQVRFIIDDGSYFNSTGQFINKVYFAALDNIRLDGYLKNSLEEEEFTVFPNPSNQEIFIRYNGGVPQGKVTYQLSDATGRIIGKSEMVNQSINVQNLPGGIYFLQLFHDNKLLGRGKKIIRH